MSDDPAIAALRNALVAAVSGAIGAHGGAVPLEVIGQLTIEASTLALRYHAQRRGVKATAETIEIIDER